MAAYVASNVNATPGSRATKTTLMNGYTGKTNETGAPDVEAGLEDNRLSLDPNQPDWKDTLASWEDGGEYTVTAKIRQISPGEFQVVEMTPVAEEEVVEEEAETEPTSKSAAAARMMEA